MRHFPVYLDTRSKIIVVSGVGACAIAKLRLLLKTEAEIRVFGRKPDALVQKWAQEGRITLTEREVRPDDFADAILCYAANDDPAKDGHTAKIARLQDVKTLVVDNLENSDFITPAIVDRAPLTVAIGTEGAAPVLARDLKAELEERLPPALGSLVTLGRSLRPKTAHLPEGQARRAFWSRFYFDLGPRMMPFGEGALKRSAETLLQQLAEARPDPGHVHFIGAGPGDPELLTLKARKLLHDADVVIHDRLVPDPILELARREATILEVGKIPFGPSWRQADINELIVNHGVNSRVVRLKSGDCGIFGRLDEETEALDLAGIAYSVVPGVTSAAAAAAELKVSLTQRGRNSGLRIVTGHEAEGFAEQDWRSLAQPGAVAAVYMGKAAAAFLQGRLLMHGAQPNTPVTIVENASRPDQTILPTTLSRLPDALRGVDGPAVLMLGLTPRHVNISNLQEAL